MFSRRLLHESETRENGTGPEIAVHESSSTLLLTLGITRILERQVLDVSVWGSVDGLDWRHLAAFPRKFYCGVYPLVLDLSRHEGIRHLRAEWKLARWHAEDRDSLCEFYLHAEDVKLQRAGAA